MMEYMKSEKKKLQDESEDRKQHMQTMELKRMQNEKLTDLEQVRKFNSQLQLSYNLRMSVCLSVPWQSPVRVRVQKWSDLAEI